MSYQIIIDTSRPEAWVALVQDAVVVAEQAWLADYTVGTKLLQVIDDFFSTNNIVWSAIDRIGVVTGPGHFSALRTGLVTAQVLAWNTSIKLVALPAVDRAVLVALVMTEEPSNALAVQYE